MAAPRPRPNGARTPTQMFVVPPVSNVPEVVEDRRAGIVSGAYPLLLRQTAPARANVRQPGNPWKRRARKLRQFAFEWSVWFWFVFAASCALAALLVDRYGR